MTIFHFYADVSKLLIMIAMASAITVIAVIMIAVASAITVIAIIMTTIIFWVAFHNIIFWFIPIADYYLRTITPVTGISFPVGPKMPVRPGFIDNNFIAIVQVIIPVPRR